MTTPPDALSTTSGTYARVSSPRWLIVLRLVWIILVAALAIARFASFEPAYHATADRFASLFGDSGITLVGVTLLPVTFAAYYFALDLIISLAHLVGGLFLFWRRSDNWVVALTALTLIGLALVSNRTLFQLIAAYPVWRPLVSLLLVTISLAAITFLAVFPDGQFIPGWARWLAVPALIVNVIAVFLAFAVSGLPPRVLTLVLAVNLIVVLIGVGIQVHRYRAIASPLQRLQTRWFVLGAGLAAVGLGLALILDALNLSGVLGALVVLILIPLTRHGGLLAFLFMGIFATLRYRLYDVDFVINRSLVYGGLTVALGIVFFGGLFLLQPLLDKLLGGQQSTTAAIISTAAVLALFQPARHRLQRLVDRRFFHLKVGLEQLNTPRPVIANPGILSGQAFGPYQIEGVLGRGAMGEVYKGHHTTLNRAVAIKILPADLAKEERFRTRFEREAQMVAALRHPNVVQLFDFGESNGTYYMVMEYIAGQELGHLVHEGGPLPLEEARPLVEDIAAALDYAHAQGVVHRDVKPSNVMLQKVTSSTQSDTASGGAPPRLYRAVLMDFGIAKMVSGGSGLTQTGFLGTLDYTAPEQIMSATGVDARADIYGLAAVVYEMLTGQTPFKGDSPGRLLFAHLNQPAPDARLLKPDVPVGAATAIMIAMAKSPDDRFQTAGEFAAALR